MTEPEPHDPLPAMLAEIDQALKMVGESARIAKAQYEAFKEEGFSERQALYLAACFLRAPGGAERMSRGHDRERRVADWLRERDWLVTRAAGSFGCADLVALKDGSRPMLVEVKSTAGGPYERFGPADRERLGQAAAMAGAEAFLAWWPPRSGLRWFAQSEWPSKVAA